MDKRDRVGTQDRHGPRILKPLTQGLVAGSIIETELDLELGSTQEGIARYNIMRQKAIGRGSGAMLKPEEQMLVRWWDDYVIEVREEQRACRRGVAGRGRAFYGSIINLIPAEKIALLAMHEIVSRCLIDPFGATLRSVAYYTGSAVVAELHANVMKERRCTPKELDKLISTGPGGARTSREINRAAKNSMEDHVWSMKVCTHLGVALIWRLVGIASAGKEGDFVLALKVKKKYKDGRATNVVVFSDEMKELLARGHFLRETMRPRFMPMVAPPLPWQYDADGLIEEGGHYRLRTPFVVKQSMTLRETLKTADLSVPFQVINTISKTPWIINEKMRRMVSSVVMTGGGCAGIPRADPRPFPPKPNKATASKEEMKSWAKTARQIHESNEEDASKRGGLILALNVAKRMSGFGAVFFPHQFDFRGRAYPVPIHLNHMGDDARRGMLLFAEAKKPENDRHLQIHTANCWGHGIDKHDIKSRINWVESIGGEITAYAKDPITNEGWMKAEDPFQFLQCCMGLIEPEIGWRIPVHFDGSANGIQHLAAITRDDIGGASVNLINAKTPGDVYSDVARAVVAILQAMAVEGNETASRCVNLITRKLVKQPVMTSVYGVTRAGVQNQLLPRLTEQGVEKHEATKLSNWLAPVVLQGIGNRCKGAAGVMQWLREAVNTILRADRKRTISWVSPMGFPVIQPYWKQKKTDILCHRACISLRLSMENDAQHIGRNKNAIVANIIHSIDASHMGMTALQCAKEGVEFAAVHDSYWTHQATGDALSSILRSVFVKLHSTNPLVSIRTDWIKRYGVELPELPPRGNLDLACVLKSQYFFS